MTNHFISRLSMIVRVNVVLNRTVVNSDRRFDNLCGSHLYSVFIFFSHNSEPITRLRTLKSALKTRNDGSLIQ